MEHFGFCLRFIGETESLCSDRCYIQPKASFINYQKPIHKQPCEPKVSEKEHIPDDSDNKEVCGDHAKVGKEPEAIQSTKVCRLRKSI